MILIIVCRLESVRAVLANGIAEDPLESEEQLQEQMDSLPYMCRFQYEYAVELIVGRMDPIVAAYQKVIHLSCHSDSSSMVTAVFSSARLSEA